MVKGITIFGLLALVLGILLISTPVSRVGSGFLIGEGGFAITYYELLKDAPSVVVKFPNEDDIKAQPIYTDPANNIALLKLDQVPKVKREPLIFLTDDPSTSDNYVFTLGYPWTNTQEDQYRLIEGSLDITNSKFPQMKRVDIFLEPVNSGSPLFNTHGVVIGMILMPQHTDAAQRPSRNSNILISHSLLERVLHKNKLLVNNDPLINHVNRVSQEYIDSIKNNIVLIEAG